MGGAGVPRPGTIGGVRSVALLRLALAALCIGGCGGGSQLVVDLVTDFAPGEEFASVRVEQLGERGRVVDTRTAAASASEDYVRGARVAELSGIEPGEHTLRVTLLDARGAEVIQRSVRVEVRSSHAVTVLITRTCRAIACPGPRDDPSRTECAGGRCVDPTCRPEEPESCLPPACERDSDCVPMASCAVGRCSFGECFFADEGACGAMRWCDPDVGCRDREVVLDAGTPDAGRSDAGTCAPRTCAELGFDCGEVIECGAPLSCGVCAPPDTCGGGAAANRCGNGDGVGPTVTITGGPDDPTRATDATFTFTADDGPGVGVDRTECRLDDGGFAPCTSPHSLSPIDEGTHTVEVRAWDRAGNAGPIASWTWTVDRSAPTIDIAPITDPAPSSYTATASVAFSFTCGDSLTSCALATRSCEIDGAPVSCGASGGTVMAGYTGAYAFGEHTLRVTIEDAAGNSGSASRTFTVTRCASDMQFPSRTSNGVARGGCCAGLVASSWYDPFVGIWHPRGDESCRAMSDFDSRNFETIWGGGSCIGGMTTYQWLQARGLPGCASAAGRAACRTSEAEAQHYCGTDGGGGAQTPLHGRASEGWHPAASAGCSGGTISTSVLMERYGAHNVCFNTVDRANDRGSLSSSELCNAGLTRFCRTNPVDPAVACVCATADPYAGDGRG